MKQSRKDRQLVAQTNAQARAKRSDVKQLELLQSRPGDKKKESARLNANIQALKVKVAPIAPVIKKLKKAA